MCVCVDCVEPKPAQVAVMVRGGEGRKEAGKGGRKLGEEGRGRKRHSPKDEKSDKTIERRGKGRERGTTSVTYSVVS